MDARREEVAADPLEQKHTHCNEHVNVSEVFEESVVTMLALADLAVLVEQVDRVNAQAFGN